MQQLELKQGRYVVHVDALDQTAEGIISVRPVAGQARAYLEDLDGDGMHEIVMENGEIRATILRIGGRVIEYILKSNQENLLFKLTYFTYYLFGHDGSWHQALQGLRDLGLVTIHK